MKKSLTILDIARLSGVSKSTVSRVLNNEPKVRPKTKDRVLQVIEENGYFPNEIARTLVRSKSKLVGLITPFQSRSFYQSEYFRDVFIGISSQLKKSDYDIITASGSGEELEAIKKFAQTYHTCGIILLYSVPDDPSLHYLLDNQIPFSLVGACEGFSGINQVAPNFHGAIMQVVDDLLRRGRSNISLWVSDPGLATERSYISGYCDAMSRHQIPVQQNYFAGGLYTESDVMNLLQRYRTDDNMPNAIIAGNDAICCDLLYCCQQLNIRIPEELAVFSLENGPANDILGISSLDLDYIGIGTMAAKILLDSLDGGDAVQSHPGYQIIHRNSTGFL